MNLTLKGQTEAAAAASEHNEAERVLESLGFSADHLHDRIPHRFLHPSKLKGIDFDYQNIRGKSRLSFPHLLPCDLEYSHMLTQFLASCSRSPVGNGRSGCREAGITIANHYWQALFQILDQ